MNFLGRISLGGSDPELLIGILGIAVLIGGGIWGLVRWVRRAATSPDPWDRSITEQLEQEQAVQLCHRCLAAQEESADFCPACGAPVGQYTNWLPYPYLFSIGHTLRIGTSGEYRRTRLTVLGFFLLGLAEYAVFAPVYWFMVLRRLVKPHSPTTTTPQEPDIRSLPGV
jgi:hypothetical protein